MEHADDFDAFYAAAYGRLVGQLYAVTGDLAEAEDAVQEAFARAVVRWPRVRRYDLPEAWVRRVAVNLARQSFRRTTRRLRLLVRLASPPVPGPSVEGLALVQALRALPPAQRQVLALHHAAGLSVGEIATQLGVPVGTAKSRLSRGRAALAALLADPEEVAADDR
jgi:RNA polymerase sigma-70 factor (ECF subfamily)